MAHIDFTIIIPTCNRPEALGVCLRAIQPQLSKFADIEVLVLDDGVTSATREMVAREFPWAQCHEGPKRGPAANRNAGAKIARGNWLVFLDDDCIPQPKLLAAYVEPMRKAGDMRIVLEGPTLREKTPPSLLWEAPHNPDGGILISCNFAIPKAVFWNVGGFDERYPFSFEDMEFADRARRCGVQIQFVAEAAVIHPLRHIPGAQKLAQRWEARVISCYDLGATKWQLLWRIPDHVAKVIISRFRGQRFTPDNLKAALLFTGEFLLVIRNLWGWLILHTRDKRSDFWKKQIVAGNAPPRFGL